MADFSQYGGASPDWKRVTAAMPPEQLVGAIPDASVIPNDQLLLKIQEATNQERAARAKRYLQEMGNRENVTVRNYTCPTSDTGLLPIRVYRPVLHDQKTKALPVYIWFHGGGFLFGSLDGEDAHCTLIALRHNVIVVNICYRHAPQWKWPTPRQDGMSGVDWVFDNIQMIGGEENKVVVAGRSAGALVAASTAIGDLKAHGRSRFCGQILDIPHLCHSASFPYELIAPGKDSLSENITAPILPKNLLDLFETLVAPDPWDPTFSVLIEEQDLKFLPPTHFHVAGRDLLRDQGLLYQQKLEQSGVSTTINIYPGVPHGFMYLVDLKESQQWANDHHEAISRLLQ